MRDSEAKNTDREIWRGPDEGCALNTRAHFWRTVPGVAPAYGAWPAIPSPRTMPVNMPFPEFGEVTIAMLDRDGNVTILKDRKKPK